MALWSFVPWNSSFSPDSEISISNYSKLCPEEDSYTMGRGGTGIFQQEEAEGGQKVQAITSLETARNLWETARSRSDSRRASAHQELFHKNTCAGIEAGTFRVEVSHGMNKIKDFTQTQTRLHTLPPPPQYTHTHKHKYASHLS